MSQDNSEHPKINAQLNMSPEEMRTLGYKVIDMLVDHYQALDEKPVQSVEQSVRVAMEARFHEPLPQRGMDANDLLEAVHQDVLEQNYHRIHPRDFAYVNSPSNFVSVLADTLASGYNVFAGAWITSPAAAMIELVTLDWLRQLISLPDATGGIFTSGGSVANLTGLAVARHIKLGEDFQNGTLYFSEQTHASVSKALRILGFGKEQIRKLPVDADFRLNLDALRDAIAEDRSRGKQPFCVVGNAGTTNTGTVDPLEDMAQICREEDLWLHIDAAYGGGAAFTEQGRFALKGIEYADSVAIDPHKWLFQPFEMGCALVRDRRHLWETFNVGAEYLKNLVDPTLQEVNFYDYGIQMSRRFRALKLWLSLKAFGADAFSQSVQRGIELAEIAERHLKQSTNWKIVTPAQLGVITFSFVAKSDTESDAINDAISQQIVNDGFAFVHTTILRERVVLRMVTLNPRTTERDIIETIDRMESFGKVPIVQ